MVLITNRLSIATVSKTSFRNTVKITFTKWENKLLVRMVSLETIVNISLWGKAWLAGKSSEADVWHLFRKTTPMWALESLCYCYWRRA